MLCCSISGHDDLFPWSIYGDIRQVRVLEFESSTASGWVEGSFINGMRERNFCYKQEKESCPALEVKK